MMNNFNDKTYSVTQINNFIKNVIDNESILENIIVLGEISSFSITRNIAYFTIKDEESVLNCVLFNAGSYASVKIGDQILARGSVKYYAKGGRLSFNAVSIEQYGKGKLYQQFLELKNKLELEGLFDVKYKKPLPENIKRIGVITSRTGAVIQDIINITKRRNPALDIVIYDVQVQGQYAADQICEGLNFFSEYPGIDLIIVARGGGSIEDLQLFNEERVARACFNCHKFVLSAVGHETDYTIIDFVADLRAPTPSAAAELVAKDITQIKKLIIDQIDKSEKLIVNKIVGLHNAVAMKELQLEKHMQTALQDITLKINDLSDRLVVGIDKLMSSTTYRVGILINTLDKLSPTKLLSKGYSVATLDELPIIDCKKISINDIITTTVLNGKLISKIIDIKEKL